MSAPWRNSRMFARSKRVYVVHLVAKWLRVRVHIHGIPFGRDPTTAELMQLRPDPPPGLLDFEL